MIHRQRSIQSAPTIRDNRRLGWYAAIFDTPATVYDFRPGAKERSHYREVVRPGAFTEALKKTGEVIANIDHDPSRTFAKRSAGQLLLQEDPIGLYCSTWLPDDNLGNAIRDEVLAGKLNAASFRFWNETDKWDGDTCELLSLDLDDVCLTDSPAYPSTRGEVHLRTNTDKILELFARLRLAKIKHGRTT